MIDFNVVAECILNDLTIMKHDLENSKVRNKMVQLATLINENKHNPQYLELIYKNILKILMNVKEHYSEVSIPKKVYLKYFHNILFLLWTLLDNITKAIYLDDMGYFLFFILGKGACANVYLAIEIDTMSLVAIKHIEYGRLKSNIHHYIENEIRISLSCSHPNIVKTGKVIYEHPKGNYQSIENPSDKKTLLPPECSNVYIIMEKSDFGDVFSFLHFYYYTENMADDTLDKTFENYILNQDRLRQFKGRDDAYVCLPLYGVYKMMDCLLKALEYLEERRIMHRDLKPSNILVFSDPNDEIFPFTFRLCDFTMGREVESYDQLLTSFVGTHMFMAKEKIGQAYNGASEIWSFGIILCNIILGGFPFSIREHPTESSIMSFIEKNEGRIRDKCSELPPGLRDFYYRTIIDDLKHILDINPHSRPTLEMLRKMNIMTLNVCDILGTCDKKRSEMLLQYINHLSTPRFNTGNVYRDHHSFSRPPSLSSSPSNVNNVNGGVYQIIEKQKKTIDDIKKENKDLQARIYQLSKVFEYGKYINKEFNSFD